MAGPKAEKTPWNIRIKQFKEGLRGLPEIGQVL